MSKDNPNEEFRQAADIGELERPEELQAGVLPEPDYEQYAPLLAELGVPDDQGKAFLYGLWRIAVHFVLAGWGDVDFCELISAMAEKSVDADEPALESENTNNTEHDDGKDGDR